MLAPSNELELECNHDAAVGTPRFCSQSKIELKEALDDEDSLKSIEDLIISPKVETIANELAQKNGTKSLKLRINRQGDC